MVSDGHVAPGVAPTGRPRESQQRPKIQTRTRLNGVFNLGHGSGEPEEVLYAESAAAKLEPLTPPQEENVTENAPAAKRRKHAAHGVSRGSKSENYPASKQRKNLKRDQEKEIERLQAAIEGAESGNWRDLRTLLELVGIGPQLKDSPS